MAVVSTVYSKATIFLVVFANDSFIFIPLFQTSRRETTTHITGFPHYPMGYLYKRVIFKYSTYIYRMSPHLHNTLLQVRTTKYWQQNLKHSVYKTSFLYYESVKLRHHHIKKFSFFVINHFAFFFKLAAHILVLLSCSKH